MHHFPLGSVITSHWKASLLPNRKLSFFPTEILPTSHYKASLLPTRKLSLLSPGSFVPSYREFSSLPTRKLFLFSPGSFVLTYWEASSPPIGKLYSCITFHQEASSLFQVNLGRLQLYWGSSTKDYFFPKKLNFSEISR